MRTSKFSLFTVIAALAISAFTLPAYAGGHDRDGDRSHRTSGFSFDFTLIFGQPRQSRCEPCPAPPPVVIAQPPLIIRPVVHAPVDVIVYEPRTVRVPYTYIDRVQVEVPVFERICTRGREVIRQVGTRFEWRLVERTGYRDEVRSIARTYRAFWDDCLGAYIYTDDQGMRHTTTG
jgi:hypothetical protein